MDRAYFLCALYGLVIFHRRHRCHQFSDCQPGG
jgi:hypothetical protein